MGIALRDQDGRSASADGIPSAAAARLRLETDYGVLDTSLTFGTAPANGGAIVAWDIVGGGIVPNVALSISGGLSGLVTK